MNMTVHDAMPRQPAQVYKQRLSPGPRAVVMNWIEGARQFPPPLANLVGKGGVGGFSPWRFITIPAVCSGQIGYDSESFIK